MCAALFWGDWLIFIYLFILIHNYSEYAHRWTTHHFFTHTLVFQLQSMSFLFRAQRKREMKTFKKCHRYIFENLRFIDMAAPKIRPPYSRNDFAGRSPEAILDQHLQAAQFIPKQTHGSSCKIQITLTGPLEVVLRGDVVITRWGLQNLPHPVHPHPYRKKTPMAAMIDILPSHRAFHFPKAACG